MGLDLYHLKPCKKEEGMFDPLELHRFDAAPDFVEANKFLIHTGFEESTFFRIYLFCNEGDKHYYLSVMGEQEDSIYLTGTYDDRKVEIARIEAWYNLEASERSSRGSSLSDKTGPPGRLVQFTTLTYTTSYEKVQSFYCKEIGYQRKGMAPEFYGAFINDQLYFKKEDVERAYRYLSASQLMLPVLQIRFREDFIENFIEGESIFEISW